MTRIPQIPARCAVPLAVAVLLAVACGGGPVEPPTIDTESLDPQLASMLEESVAGVRDNPQDAWSWYALGMGYHANEYLEPAEACYRRALELDPELVHAWYHLARLLQRTGRVEEAVDTMAEAGARDDGYAPIHWRRGAWLMELGRLDDAEQAYRRAAEIAPGDVAGPLGLAHVKLERGAFEEASVDLARILERWPHDPQAHLLMGRALRPQERVEEAEFHLAYGQGEPVIRADDWTSEQVLYRPAFNDKLKLSNQYLAAGHVEIATHMLEGLRQEKPEHLRTLLTLSQAYRQADRAGDALAVLRDAAERHPDNYSVVSELPPALDMLGRTDEALAAAERAIEMQPQRALSWMRKGAVLLGANRAEEARAAYARALELDASDPRIPRSLGDCAAALGDWERAQAMYARALELESRDPDLYVRLGYAAFKQENWDEAVRALRRAQRLGPTRPENVERLLLESEKRSGAGVLLPGAIGS